LIETAAGELPIEEISIGDRVRTNSGRLETVRWIGRRSYSRRFAIGNPGVLPICIRPGALAEGLPRRDLFVSPHHGLLINGVLVAAGALVNGRTIIQLLDMDPVEYLHIELDRHAIILAEGTPAETFLAEQGRAQFQNAAEHDQLYPDMPPRLMQPCAVRLGPGLALDLVRNQIAARAECLSTMRRGVASNRKTIRQRPAEPVLDIQ
jgi:hypothetical protein